MTDLLVVDDLALELLFHLFLRGAVVVDDGLVAQLQAVQLAADGLEEGAASRARPAEDCQQLAAVEQAVEAVEDLLVLLFPGAKRLAEAEWLEEHRVHRLLELQRRTRPEHIEVSETDSHTAELVALFIEMGHKVLHPLGDVEVGGFGIQRRLRRGRLFCGCGVGLVPREDTRAGLVPREGGSDPMELG